MEWNYTNREPLHGVKKDRQMRDLAEALIHEMGAMRRKKARRATHAVEKMFREAAAIEGATWTEGEYLTNVGDPFEGLK
jgi:hypothetical protein